MKGDRPGPAPRVRVTSSRREATRHTARPAADEVAEHTDLGEVYVRGLMRAQLRLAASVLLVGAIVLGALPLVFLAMHMKAMRNEVLRPARHPVALVDARCPYLPGSGLGRAVLRARQ